MRTLDTSNITNTVAMPIKSGTLDHLQLAYKEAIGALAQSIIGRLPQTNQMYILFGLENSGTSSMMTVSAGAVYYMGEVYLVDAFTLSVTQAAVAGFVTSQYTINADPVTFTNGTIDNVHDIKKVSFTNAATGTGLCDFDNLTHVPQVMVRKSLGALPTSAVAYFDEDQSLFYTAPSGNVTINIDVTNSIPGTVVRMAFPLTSAQTLTVYGGTKSVVNETGVTSSGAGNYILYLLYVGRNAANVDEIVYNLKKL